MAGADEVAGGKAAGGAAGGGWGCTLSAASALPAMSAFLFWSSSFLFECPAWCEVRLDFHLNLREQPWKLQTKGLSPVWTRRWALRLKRLENCLAHCVHGQLYSGSPPGSAGGMARFVAYAYAASTVHVPGGAAMPTGPSIARWGGGWVGAGWKRGAEGGRAGRERKRGGAKRKGSEARREAGGGGVGCGAGSGERGAGSRGGGWRAARREACVGDSGGRGVRGGGALLPLARGGARRRGTAPPRAGHGVQ